LERRGADRFVSVESVRSSVLQQRFRNRDKRANLRRDEFLGGVEMPRLRPEGRRRISALGEFAAEAENEHAALSEHPRKRDS
jgi:hypothetical protein